MRTAAGSLLLEGAYFMPSFRAESLIHIAEAGGEGVSGQRHKTEENRWSGPMNEILRHILTTVLSVTWVATTLLLVVGHGFYYVKFLGRGLFQAMREDRIPMASNMIYMRARLGLVSLALLVTIVICFPVCCQAR